MSATMNAAIDFGISNTKLVIADADGRPIELSTRPSARPFEREDALRAALRADGKTLAQFSSIAVTGGKSATLPDRVDGVPIVKVPELAAIGRGGLRLLREQTGAAPSHALVVSCGTGTAMMAVRGDSITQSTGTGIGGGTLLGLGRLLLDIGFPHDLDALAGQGDPAGVDLTLTDAVGGAFGGLPPDTTAVNFGKQARPEAARPSRADIAAGLVTLIAQAIASLALTAARAEGLDRIVMVGHLPSLPSVAAQLRRAASFHDRVFDIPDQGGYAMAIGALSEGRSDMVSRCA
jgi:type II pantothenate kinase